MAALRFRNCLRYAIGAVLLAALGLFALAWIAGREPALQWIARELEARSGGALVLENVRGSLYGPLEASRVLWDDEAVRVEAQGVRIDWSPAALLAGRLALVSLDVTRLHVLVTKQDTSAPQPPAGLEAPLVVSLAHVRFGEIVVRSGARSDTLRGVEFSARLGRNEHQLIGARALTPWGALEAQATLGARPPLRVTGHALLAGEGAQNAYRIDARISGVLQDIGILFKAGSGPARARGEARIAPFAEARLVAAQLDAEGIDPAALRAGMPSANVGAQLRVRAEPQGRYTGTAVLKNAAAGTLDAKRIPARLLSFSFAGDWNAAALEEVVVDLGAAGAFTGTGKVRDGRVELALATRQFDLRGLERSLRATRLAGAVRLALSESGQTLIADLAQADFTLQLDAALEAGRLQLNQARVRSGTGVLSLSGGLALEPPREFHAEATLSQLNLAEFGDYPLSAINGTARARGKLMPRPAGDVELDIRGSRIRGYPLAATGHAQLATDRVDRAALDLVLAGNRLELRGSYGKPGDRMDWVLAAPQIGRIADGLAGSVTGTGSLQGPLDAPAVAMSLEGDDLRLPGGYAAARLKAELSLAQGLEGSLALEARARGIRSGKFTLDDVRVSAQGTRDRHRIRLAAGGAGIDLSAAAEGGWRHDSGWNGRLVSLEQRGRIAVRLEEPARIAVGREGFSVERVNAQAGAARVQIEALTHTPAQSASRGAFTGLPLAMLQPVLGLPGEVQSGLVLGGNWNVAKRAGGPWVGSAELARESGDLIVTVDQPLALDITRFAASAQASAGSVVLTAVLAGGRLGTLEAAAQLSLGEGMLPVVARNAPLDARLTADVPSIAWLAGMSKRPVRLEGAIRANLAAGGTWAAPKMTGSVAGEKLALSDAEHGVNLVDGRFHADLAGSEVQMRTFRFGAGEGHFEARGRLGLAVTDPEIAIDWKATNLEAIRRPDRHVVLSGAGKMEVRQRRLWLTGKLSADRGLIELAERTGVTLSDDVLVKGRAAPEQPERPLLAQLDLDLDLGDRFYLKGLGLDARLAGRVRLRAEGKQLPTATGSIRVTQGSYSAYGQRLAIERGILSFTGPVDNPGLDVIALRKNLKVEAGVAVTGTASAPRVRLVSQPEVSDNDKLSWLVLGRGPDTASRGDAALLQAAAAALLSQGESATLQGQIAQAADLDEFGFRTGGTVQSSVMTLGKRLSSNVYLAYEQGLFAAASVVKLRYTLTPSLTLQTQAGTENAVDLFYNLFFD